MQTQSPLSSSNGSGFEEVSFARDLKALDPDPAPQRLPLISPPQLPSIPLQGFGHSLVPDMVFGWRPKLSGGPIPLIFDKRELQVQEEGKTIYHGFRPRDSRVLHEATGGAYPLPATVSLDVFEFLHQRDARLQDRRPFQGMSPGVHPVIFDSQFESGNLDRVVHIREYEYDLYLRADANTKGYYQWFYFSAESRDAREITLNILNFTKSESLYRQGMKPVVLSQTQKRGWRRTEGEVKYGISKLTSVASRVFYTLSFTYKFPPQGDKVYFAYSVPYTYSRLHAFLGSLSPTQYVTREVLCKTLSGIDVPLLTITNPTSFPKDHILVTSRIHPGETHGSWVTEVTSP